MTDLINKNRHVSFHARIVIPTHIGGIGFLIGLTLLLSSTSSASDLSALKVAENQRYLETTDGEPFFYLGDTAWELFHRLNREEADLYLSNRAEKGFTVIQAVVLAQLGGLTDPNPYGDLPLIDKDPTQPNEAYFKHVDFIVKNANELGLYIGMLPSWGKYWKQVQNESSIFNAENARIYGRFLGERYKDQHVIWILGGDRNIENDEEREIINAMAEGLEEGDGGSHLKTYHPRGPGLSSDHFHNADWLDFNMFQSSHGARGHDNGLFAAHDYALQPIKPTLDGEPRYESIPIGFYFKGTNEQVRFEDGDARQAAYWSLLAGACGHTYGNNNIWQMWRPGRSPIISAHIPWDEAIDHPGAFQMGYVRRLFESRPWWILEPDQSLIVDGPKMGAAKIRAARANDGSFAFIYTPQGEQFTIDRSQIKAKRVKEIWYDPRYGAAYHIHTSDNAGCQTYTPPSSGWNHDWILILEDENAKFPMPQPK